LTLIHRGVQPYQIAMPDAHNRVPLLLEVTATEEGEFILFLESRVAVS
jgi:hypothetical protein